MMKFASGVTVYRHRAARSTRDERPGSRRADQRLVEATRLVGIDVERGFVGAGCGVELFVGDLDLASAVDRRETVERVAVAQPPDEHRHGARRVIDRVRAQLEPLQDLAVHVEQPQLLRADEVANPRPHREHHAPAS